MKLSDVQAFILGLIAADPTLGPDNSAVAFDIFATQEAQRATINNLTRTNGYCIEVSTPSVPQSDTLSGGESFADAMVEVYVAEDRTVTHTPSGLLLCEYVKGAILQRNQKPQHLTKFHSQDMQAVTVQGLLLHQLTFAVRVDCRPGTLPVV